MRSQRTVQQHLLHAGQQGLGVHPRFHSQVGNEARTEVACVFQRVETLESEAGGYEGHELTH